jgi:hypothetical protein
MGVDKPKLSARDISEGLYQDELLGFWICDVKFRVKLSKFESARAKYRVNFSILDVRQHDHACSGTT